MKFVACVSIGSKEFRATLTLVRQWVGGEIVGVKLRVLGHFLTREKKVMLVPYLGGKRELGKKSNAVRQPILKSVLINSLYFLNLILKLPRQDRLQEMKRTHSI